MNYQIVFAFIFWIFEEINKEERIYRISEATKQRDDSFQSIIHFDSYSNATEIEDFFNICNNDQTEQCAIVLLKDIDLKKKRNINRYMNILFKYSSNITEENEKLKVDITQKIIKFNQKIEERLKKFQWQQFQSPRTRRIFQMLVPTIESRNTSISQSLVNISSRIEFIYNNGRPCFRNCLEKGERDIVNLFKTEKNYDKLLGFWVSWRNETGRKIRKLFVEKVRLRNIGAKENQYSDAASFDLEMEFEENKFNETIMNLYEDIVPLYKELHSYVRYCLAKYYPGRFDKKGPIPAHVLGNLWAQNWENVFPIIQNCQKRNVQNNIQMDINKRLRSVSVPEMVRMSERFFTSLGMFEMTPYFWERSVFQKPKDRVVDCHGTAYDFSNNVDYRIMMCTKQDFNDFYTIHHEMGHIQYFMAYKNQPFVFQDSANTGFHEAIGDTIALSVSSPEHLQKVGLISSLPKTEEFDIDFLLLNALDKISFLPFALTMDSYIWSVYNGSVPSDKLNEHWWRLRHQYQGVKAPIERSEEDFDPGAKYHIAFGVSYIRYFVSFIHQFQFYESMCKLSGYSGPLHRCDFYGSKIAGGKLLEMLQKGKSQHWRDSLKILTGNRDISSQPLLKYFSPLYKWLKATNRKLNIPVGW